MSVRYQSTSKKELLASIQRILNTCQVEIPSLSKSLLLPPLAFFNGGIRIDLNLGFEFRSSSSRQSLVEAKATQLVAKAMTATSGCNPDSSRGV